MVKIAFCARETNMYYIGVTLTPFIFEHVGKSYTIPIQMVETPSQEGTAVERIWRDRARSEGKCVCLLAY